MPETNTNTLFSYTYLFNLILLFVFYGLVLRVMVFNATFNSKILQWRSVLLVEPRNRIKPSTCRKSLANFINVVSSTPRHERDCLLWKER